MAAAHILGLAKRETRSPRPPAERKIKKKGLTGGSSPPAERKESLTTLHSPQPRSTLKVLQLQPSLDPRSPSLSNY